MAISPEELNDWIIWEENGLLRASKTEVVYLSAEGAKGLLSMPIRMDQDLPENPNRDHPS